MPAHMSTDMALRFSGWLNTTRPTPSSMPARILPPASSICVVILRPAPPWPSCPRSRSAESPASARISAPCSPRPGTSRYTPVSRPSILSGLATMRMSPRVRCRIGMAISRCCTCGSSNTSRMLLTGPQGMPASSRVAIQYSEGLVRVTSDTAALTLARSLERPATVCHSGTSSQSSRPAVRQKIAPELGRGGGDVDRLVGGGEHAHRDVHRVVVAGLARHLAIHQEAAGLEVQHEDLRFQQRGVDIAALARALPVVELHHHAERQQVAGGQVVDRGCRRASGRGRARR